MKKTPKIRTNLNVSLRHKKYKDSINEIVQGWEDDGLNVSTEVCDRLLLAEKIAKSPTLLKVISAYELAEKLLSFEPVEDKDGFIEEFLSKSITINSGNVVNVSPNNYTKPISKPYIKEEQSPINKPIEVIEEPIEVIEEKVIKNIVDEDDFEYSDDEYDVNEDMLFNE